MVKAAASSQIERVYQTALASLSDADLRQLRDGLSGEAGDSLPDPAVGRYGEACDAAAIRLTGGSCPALELSAHAVAREISNRCESARIRPVRPQASAPA